MNTSMSEPGGSPSFRTWVAEKGGSSTTTIRGHTADIRGRVGSPPSANSRTQQLRLPQAPDQHKYACGATWVVLSKVATKLQRLQVRDDAVISPAPSSSYSYSRPSKPGSTPMPMPMRTPAAVGQGTQGTQGAEDDDFSADDDKENTAPPHTITNHASESLSLGAHTDDDDDDDDDDEDDDTADACVQRRNRRIRIRPIEFWEAALGCGGK